MNETENVASDALAKKKERKERKKELERLRTILAKKGWHSELRDAEHGLELVVLADSPYKAAMLDRFLRHLDGGLRCHVATWHSAVHSGHSGGLAMGHALVQRSLQYDATITQAASTWLHEQAELQGPARERPALPEPWCWGVLVDVGDHGPEVARALIDHGEPFGGDIEPVFWTVLRSYEVDGLVILDGGQERGEAVKLAELIQAAGGTAEVYWHGESRAPLVAVAVDPRGPNRDRMGTIHPYHQVPIVGDPAVTGADWILVYDGDDIARRYGLPAPATATH